MIRKNWLLIVMSVVVALLLLGYIMKENLYDFISKKIKDSAGTEISITGEEWVE